MRHSCPRRWWTAWNFRRCRPNHARWSRRQSCSRLHKGPESAIACGFGGCATAGDRDIIHGCPKRKHSPIASCHPAPCGRSWSNPSMLWPCGMSPRMKLFSRLTVGQLRDQLAQIAKSPFGVTVEPPHRGATRDRSARPGATDRHTVACAELRMGAPDDAVEDLPELLCRVLHASATLSQWLRDLADDTWGKWPAAGPILEPRRAGC